MSGAKWGALVAAWESSGDSAGIFAARHNVAEASLRWWKTELARRAKRRRDARAQARPTLARVIREGEPVPVDHEARPPIVIEASGARILVQHAFDAQLLRAVIRALNEGV